MMAVQTSYTVDQEDRIVGMQADSAPAMIESFFAETEIPFGAAVVLGTADNQVKLAEAGGQIAGIALRAHTIPLEASGTDSYKVGDPVAVLREGNAFVEVTVDVDNGETAYAVASGVNQGNATITSSGTLGPLGTFQETVTAGGLAKLAVRMPSPALADPT